MRKWAQKVKPGRLACCQVKNGTLKVISRKSILQLGYRILPKLHFCYNKKFCTSSLGKVIEPGSQNCDDFSSPGISYWEEVLMAKWLPRNFEPGRPGRIWPSKSPPNKDFCLFRQLHFLSPLAPPLVFSVILPLAFWVL